MISLILGIILIPLLVAVLLPTVSVIAFKVFDILIEVMDVDL